VASTIPGRRPSPSTSSSGTTPCLMTPLTKRWSKPRSSQVASSRSLRRSKNCIAKLSTCSKNHSANLTPFTTGKSSARGQLPWSTSAFGMIRNYLLMSLKACHGNHFSNFAMPLALPHSGATKNSNNCDYEYKHPPFYGSSWWGTSGRAQVISHHVPARAIIIAQVLVTLMHQHSFTKR